MKSIVDSIVEKSINCAISAIEIYNKPDFKYREETFAILMINAWELILKAKKIKDNKGNVKKIYIKKFTSDKNNKLTKKWKYDKSKISGAYKTIGLDRLLSEFENNNNIDVKCIQNIRLLEDIRNNAVHLMNRDYRLTVTVYELGTANLKNYVVFIKEYFDKDLTQYNFYLMPISFYNLETVISTINISKNDYIENLRSKICELNKIHKSNPNDKYNIVLSTLITFTKSKEKYSSVNVIKDNDEEALKVKFTGEEISERYPLYYDELIEELYKRYVDFNRIEFNKINCIVRKNINFAYPRYLDDKNQKGACKWIYSRNIIQEFDKYFNK